MLTLRYNEPVFILMLEGEWAVSDSVSKKIMSARYTEARQLTLPLSIRINTGSLYRNISILNYKRDKDNVN